MGPRYKENGNTLPISTFNGAKILYKLSEIGTCPPFYTIPKIFWGASCRNYAIEDMFNKCYILIKQEGKTIKSKNHRFIRMSKWV